MTSTPTGVPLITLGWFLGSRPWWREPDFGFGIEESFEGEAYRFSHLVLLSADGALVDGVAYGHRAGRADSFRKKVRFSEWASFPPFPVAGALQVLKGSTLRAASDTLHSKIGGFTPAASKQILDWLAVGHPEAHEAVAEFLARRQLPEWLASPDAPGNEIYVHQFDGFRIGLTLAGFDRGEAFKRVSHPLAPENLQLASLREDQIVANDVWTFLDWPSIPHVVSGASFTDPMTGRRLRTFLANKLPVEEQTGADIIYYLEDFESFVLVQYKRCIQEGKTLLYRPDGQLEREVGKLRSLDELTTATRSPNLAGHRIGRPFCFIKRCSPNQPLDAEMSQGKYFDLHGFELSLSVGPRDGRRLMYDDVSRYITNTLFVDLVSQGWIGSAGAVSEAVMGILEDSLNNDRSVLLASIRYGSSNSRGRPTGDFVVSTMGDVGQSGI